MATGALHGCIEANTDAGHGPRVDTGINYGERSTVATTNEKGTFTPAMVERPVDPNDGTITETFVAPTTDGSDGEYARQFGEDPAAREINLSHVPDTVDRIKELRSKYPESKITVKIDGLVSAEDDGDNAGLTEPSKRNAELGRVRARTYETALNEAGLSNVDNVVVEIGHIEDKLSKDQVKTLEGMAKQFGYDNVEQMVGQWNTNPQDSPPSVGALLDGWLDNRDEVKRGVQVEVSVDRPNMTDASEPGTEEVCVQYTVPLRTVMDEQPEVDVTIPYGLLTLGLGMAGGLSSAGLKDLRLGRRRTIREGIGLDPIQGEFTDSELRRMVRTGYATTDEAIKAMLPLDTADSHDGSTAGSELEERLASATSVRERVRRARQRLAPLLLPLAVVGGSALALGRCSDSPPKPEKPPAADPCNGEKPIREPSPDYRRATKTYLNGRLEGIDLVPKK